MGGDMGRLDGKVIVVSGAGSGLGEGAAGAFVHEGAKVGLLDRNEEAIRGLAERLGPAAFPLPCDVTSESSVESAFSIVRERHGRLDGLFCYAAVQLVGEDQPVQDCSLDVWERTYAVNARGVFLVCKHGAKLMIAAGNGGSIVNCGSPTGLTMSGAGYSAYGSSKAAVMGLTRIMAADLAQYGIRVNGIIPGSIITPLTKKLYDDPEISAKLHALHPIGRVGLPEDMNGVAVFLASDESKFATGAHFTVDGGVCVR